MKWQQALEDYKDYLRIERGLSQNTIKNYSLDLEKLIKWIDAASIQKTPITISEETVQQFIYTIAKEMQPQSQSRIISGLRGFFNYLVFEGVLKEIL